MKLRPLHGIIAGAVLAMAGVGGIALHHGPSASSIPLPPPRAAGSCQTTGGLPDAHCTPGVVSPNVTQANIGQTICKSGWTATIRPPTSYTNALKVQQMREYGLNLPTSAVEEDHLISLELGGSPTSPLNLWPQLWTGTNNAHEKDATENRLKSEVCAGKISLIAAQKAIAADWVHAP